MRTPPRVPALSRRRLQPLQRRLRHPLCAPPERMKTTTASVWTARLANFIHGISQIVMPLEPLCLLYTDTSRCKMHMHLLLLRHMRQPCGDMCHDAGENLVRSCDDDRYKQQPPSGKGWRAGNAEPWTCSRTSACDLNLSWGCV